jgi:hypothetical protein
MSGYFFGYSKFIPNSNDIISIYDLYKSNESECYIDGSNGWYVQFITSRNDRSFVEYKYRICKSINEYSGYLYREL